MPEPELTELGKAAEHLGVDAVTASPHEAGEKFNIAFEKLCSSRDATLKHFRVAKDLHLLGAKSEERREKIEAEYRDNVDRCWKDFNREHKQLIKNLGIVCARTEEQRKEELKWRFEHGLARTEDGPAIADSSRRSALWEKSSEAASARFLPGKKRGGRKPKI